MSLNLIDAAKGLFTSEVVSKASSYLGESDSGISKALSGIVPTIFAGLANKVSTTDAANSIAQMAQDEHHSGIQENIGTMFSNESGGLMNKASGFISNLFGSKTNAVTDLISNFSGLKTSSISSLFAIASPLIMSFLGKHAAANNLNAGGISSLLNSQKHNIAAAMPADLSLQSVFDYHNSATSEHTVQTAATIAYDEAASVGSGIKWLLPVLILALLAAAALYFFKDSFNKTTPEITVADTTAAVNGDSLNATTAAALGTVDSLGNFIYNLGNMVSIELPNNAGKLDVGENSTEAKLVKFLQNPNAAIDTAKGNWFEFTNVRFKTGSAVITDESMAQLTNMVMIAKAFPSAKFKIGGYTDNTGNEASNVTLSKSRAAVVANKLISLGSTKESIVGSDGYGSQFPIGDNATAEGRAQNRRVSVNVKAK
jgi:outer membrane protein OmpA-like peptidoglycan-associated protein